jgi:hypothetical protein
VMAKRLGLLRELVPAAARTAVLVNPANAATTETTLRDAEPAARAMGLQIQLLIASTNREIDAAFAMLARAARRPLNAIASTRLLQWTAQMLLRCPTAHPPVRRRMRWSSSCAT